MNKFFAILALSFASAASAQVQCEAVGRIDANCAAVVRLQSMGVSGPLAYQSVMGQAQTSSQSQGMNHSQGDVTMLNRMRMHDPVVSSAPAALNCTSIGNGVWVPVADCMPNRMVERAVWQAEKADIVEAFRNGK